MCRRVRVRPCVRSPCGLHREVQVVDLKKYYTITVLFGSNRSVKMEK
jgi:hypothetical protein